MIRGFGRLPLSAKLMLFDSLFQQLSFCEGKKELIKHLSPLRREFSAFLFYFSAQVGSLLRVFDAVALLTEKPFCKQARCH